MIDVVETGPAPSGGTARFPGVPAIVDGSEAIAHVETRISEVACAYPITGPGLIESPDAPSALGVAWTVSREAEDLNRRLLRARDAMDRAYAEPLDVRAVAAVAHISEAHFSRSFRAVFGETPHRYLQRRRVERSMFLLRETDRSVTDICLDVGFTSLGTFSRMFREIVGETPSSYRRDTGRSWPPTASRCGRRGRGSRRARRRG